MDEADEDISDLHFLGVVESLLRDPEERENFFQEVFPEEFGPMYDKAIQTLMCHFLNRLEMLLPTQTIQQVASLLGDAPSVLEECIESVSHPEDLKTLLEYQNDLRPLQDNDISIEGTRIMSALVLPPVERVVIVSEQTHTGADAPGGCVYTACTAESAAMTESKEMDTEGTGAIEECAENQQWFYISNDVKTEGDADLMVTEQVEYIEPIDGENVENVDDTLTAFVTADGIEYKNGDGETCQTETEYGVEAETVMVIGEDGTTMPLGAAISKKCDMVKLTKRRINIRKIQGSEKGLKLEKDCAVLLERLDMPVPSQSRAVRPNRGLKMKTFLSQRRKNVSRQGRSTGTFSNTQSSSNNANLDQRTCKICGKIVSRVKFLQSHMNRHSAELPYPCSACKRRYKSSRSLQEHRCPSRNLKNISRCKRSRKVSEETSKIKEEAAEESASGAPCEASDEDSPSDSTAQDPSYPGPAEKRPSKKSRLMSPECNENTTEGPFCCPHCGIEFKTKQSLRHHLRNICFDSQQVDPENVDDNTQCFKCDECGKAFRFKSTLESHKHTHNPLYCEVCMKLVRDSEALAMHKISHTPFQCNKCDENFRVFKALYKHYIDVHNPSGPFTCPHCQETLGSLKRFIRHEWKHTGHQPFQCPNCPKRFRSYSDVQDHQKKHTKEKPFLCWECGKSFRHNITLTRHVEHKHSKPGQPIPEKVPASLACPQCDKVFNSRQCLLHHDNVHHKGVRFPCSHCGKEFFSSNALVRHTLIHTGERPFECNVCQKTFRSASELKIHVRYHTGERPFKCSICDKGFVQSCFLTLHMRTHTGERPYVCPVCSKRFQSLHCMKRHKKLVHS